MPFEQLPLDISMEPAATLDNFVVGANGEALSCLKKMRESAEPQLAYLWGESGVGKTHLAIAMGLRDCAVPTFSDAQFHYAVDDVDTLSEERPFDFCVLFGNEPQCVVDAGEHFPVRVARLRHVFKIEPRFRKYLVCFHAESPRAVPDKLCAFVNAPEILPESIAVSLCGRVFVIRHASLFAENHAAGPVDDDVLQVWCERHVIATFPELAKRRDIFDDHGHGLFWCWIELYPFLFRVDCVCDGTAAARIDREIIYEILVMRQNLAVVLADDSEDCPDLVRDSDDSASVTSELVYFLQPVRLAVDSIVVDSEQRAVEKGQSVGFIRRRRIGVAKPPLDLKQNISGRSHPRLFSS